MKLENLHKTPFMLLIVVIVVVLLIVGIFRGMAPTLGFGFYAHLGGVRGAVSFETFENSQPTFAIFYAPWCGHCKQAKPEFEKLVSDYKGNTKIHMVNGDENKELVKQHGVQGFPSLRYYPRGLNTPSDYKEYTGERTFQSMKDYLDSM